MYKHKYLEGNWQHDHLKSEDTTADSTLGPLIYSAMGLWLGLHYQIWNFFFMEQASNHISYFLLNSQATVAISMHLLQTDILGIQKFSIVSDLGRKSSQAMTLLSTWMPLCWLLGDHILSEASAYKLCSKDSRLWFRARTWLHPFSNISESHF